MKKWKLSTIVVGLTFAICSCNSTGTIAEWEEDAVKNICISIEPTNYEDGFSRVETSVTTKVDFAWEANDTIGIFPEVGGQVEFPITGSGIGTSSAKFTGGGWALRMNHWYYAYYPFNHSNRKVTSVPFSYLGQEQDGAITDTWEHLSHYIFLAAPPAQTASGNVDFKLKHRGNVLTATLTLPKATTYKAMTVYADAAVFPVRKCFDLTKEEITETVLEYSDHLTLKLKNVTTSKKNEVVVLSIVMPSCSAGTYPLKVAVYDKNGYAYTGNFTKANGDAAYVSFTAGSAQNRKASLQLQEGFNTGIEDWITSEKIEGTLQ